jgi:hypothetical protein
MDGSEGPTSSTPLGNPTAPQKVVQPTLGTNVLKKVLEV